MSKGHDDSRPSRTRLPALFIGLIYVGPRDAQSIAISPTTMPRVATVDLRYQSYNVEMAEVIGGTFWKAYEGDAADKALQTAKGARSGTAGLQAGQDKAMFEARPPIDLADARLRKLTAALGPAYLRVSGTWANSVYFHDLDTPAPASPPPGFGGVLTSRQCQGSVRWIGDLFSRVREAVTR